MGYPIKAIKKALRVRRKMFYLARAKETTIRALCGLPPVMSWGQACWTGLMDTVRVTLCRAFCPCYIAGKLRFMEFLCPRTTCIGRTFYDGQYENEVLKSCLGFVFGIVLSLTLYAWLTFANDYPLKWAAIICCVLGVVFTLGMAFSCAVRCMVFLTLPEVFSKQGRNVLIVYATVLVFSYPVKNFNANLQVMADSTTCGQELMLNETKKMFAFATDPLSAMYDALKALLAAMKRFAKMLLAAFKALIRAIKEICAAIVKVFKWLYSLVDICNERMGEPYRKCKKAFDDAYSDCRDRLGIFKFLCEIVTAASHLCNIARIGELLCAIGSLIKGMVVGAIERTINGPLGDLYTMFYFNITMEHTFTYSIKQSRSYTEVREAIMAEIKAKLSGFNSVLAVLDNAMMMTVIIIFYQACSYRSRYLAQERFDNYYITEYIQEMDARRRELGRESIFPLKKSEQLKYIPLTSLWLTKKEAMSLMQGIAFWAFGAYYACFYLLTDYGLWWILDMVTRHLDVKTQATVPAYLQLHVNGKGAMADMYRGMVGMLDPVAGAGLDVDTSPCLPRPHEPNWAVYNTIIFIYVFTFFITVGEAYGLRLRRCVAACYYPQRERERAIWLYNHILYMRGGFFKFVRRQLRRKYMNETEIQKSSILGRIVHQFPCLGRLATLLGYSRKNCLLCGKEGKPDDVTNFSHCGNHGCTAVYCTECYDELNNLCTVCMNPVEYGDLSDASEEMDSSEDEDLVAYRKEQARMKRAQREARLREKEKRASKTVTQFKGMVLGPAQRAESMPLLAAGPEEEGSSGSSDDDTGDATELGSSLWSNGSETQYDSGSETEYDSGSETEYDMAYQEADKALQSTSSTDSDSDWRSSAARAPSMVNAVQRRRTTFETISIFRSDSGSLSTSSGVSTDSVSAPTSPQNISRQ